MNSSLKAKICTWSCRTLLFALAGALAVALLVSPGMAQEKFPSQAIEVVTHAGPGGGTDITTRMMMLRGRRQLKVDMVVVNRRGGAGAVAMNYIAGRPRDGYTIMTITPTHLLTIARGKSPLKIDDLVGIARATDDPQIIMVRADSPYKTIDDFLKASKKKSHKWGITQIGGIDHITSFTFAKKTGIKLDVVPFKGGGDIVINLMGGNVDVGLLNLSEAEAQVSAGEIRPLMVLAKKRMKPLPDVPTSVERGIDAVFSTVRGFVALKGVPEDRLQVLEKNVLKAMEHKVYQGYLQGAGLTPESVVGRKEWEAQFQQLYKDGIESLRELGMLK